MENIFNRLQFVHHNEVFNTRDEAISYVINKQMVERPSLVAEPMILLYNSGSTVKGPNVILAIGSVGEGTANQGNRTFFIDTQKTEEEIEEIRESIEEAIKSLALIPLDSNTLSLNSEKTENGTIISGDVKIADYRIVSGKVNENIIQTEGNKGIYAFVDMNYDPETFTITFNVNGVTKEFELPKDQHVISGVYKPEDESIYLKLADGNKIQISVSKLIDEWTVLPESSTPITLTKTHVSATTDGHEGVYDWQDILEADVRVADHITDNILHKDGTGRYLYVKGTADNIAYKGGQTVKDALDNVDTRVSTSSGNLIYKRQDGIYAYAMLNYNSAENRIQFTYSDGNTTELKTVEYQLNSVKIIDDITYDSSKEVIVIRYIDAQGEYQRVEIPAKDIIEEWDVNNEAHSVQLSKYRSQGQGKDILTADVKIYEGDNNILEDKDHKLYVEGVAKNIKYDATGETTIKEVIDEMSTNHNLLNDKVDQEITDRKASDKKFDDTIGTGFTSNPYENITAKFNALDSKVDDETNRATTAENSLDEKIDSEATRATSAESVLDEKIDSEEERATRAENELDGKILTESNRAIEKENELDGKIESIETEIGDGFGPRNTVRDEIDSEKAEREAADASLMDAISQVSGNTDNKLSSIVNNDHSINVDNTDSINPVIKVNLSTEVEDNKPNIIKLNNDGLYAGVDLIYEFNEEVGTNQLIFKTTNGTKVYDLKTNSVVDKIYYDPSREAIIIEYTVNGHRMPDVVIPVGDLIREWKPSDNTDGAIRLTLTPAPSGTTDKDVLYGEVLISEIHGNILENENGKLYVSNSAITANTAAIEAIENRMDAAEEGISTEREERIAADSTLHGEIEAEALRAQNVEQQITSAVNTEVERSQREDNALRNAINSEVSRATEKEAEILSRLNDEIYRSAHKDNELTSSLNDEIIRATSAETALNTAITDEAERAAYEESVIKTSITNETLARSTKDSELADSINGEISRSIAKDEELYQLIINEANRATEKDAELYEKISDEKSAREIHDATLDAKIDTEKSRAQVAENTISGMLATEISNRENADNNLSNAIAAETAARQAGDDSLRDAINAATLTFDDTNSIDLNKDSNNKVTAKVKLSNATDNIILIDNEGGKEGVYASVDFDYDSATNKIRFKVNGEEKIFTIAAGSILDNAWYDSTTKELVFRTKTAEGEFVEIRIPAYDLFNELEVVNPVENSAIELTLVTGRTDPTTHEPLNDQLSGKVILSNLADNALVIDSNGLYVSNSGATLAECANKKADKVYSILYGQGYSMADCGENAGYVRGTGCIISAATSFSEADQMLNDAFCSFMDNWEVYGFDTESTHTDWKKIGHNRHMLVDVRLSHGVNGYAASGMSDDELTITDFSGGVIEPSISGFTDTNVLRIVNLTQGKSGEPLGPDNKYNGVYLSNVWDCGMYYGTTEADIAAKAAAEAAGYNTNYSTDESEEAQNYDYMNNVRQ